MENTPNMTYSGLSIPQKYEHLHTFWNGIADDQVDWVANLSNAAALMKEIFNWWWVGFYRVQNNMLILGPFQGPSACTKIDFGKGVCGSSWKNESTIVVPNVHEFEGHIACSSISNSEIVIPIFKDNKIWGVLDVDSEHLNHFNDIDKIELEKFCQSISAFL
jgi:L-methionine (R)-S-oxide reductase